MAICALGVAACDSPSDAHEGPDGGGDGNQCVRPSLDDPGLEAYVMGVVAQLAVAPRYLSTERSNARTYLMEQLSAQGWQPQLHSYSTGANVIGTVPPTMGNGQTIIVGAHFDTVQGSPGANDNASGVAVVLAVGRYLKATPCRTASVVLAFFDQEELGLVGSRAYAKTLSVADVRAVHSIDQVAWDADGDQRFELELPPSTLEAEWRAAASAVGAQVSRTSTSGTDHEAFRDLGFAAMGLTEEYVGGDTSAERHQATDTPASIAPYVDYLMLASRLTAQGVINEVSPP